MPSVWGQAGVTRCVCPRGGDQGSSVSTLPFSLLSPLPLSVPLTPSTPSLSSPPQVCFFVSFLTLLRSVPLSVALASTVFHP